MKSTAIRPRPDQIAELTRGLQLPLAEIETEHLEIIAECLSRAFNDVRAQWPDTVASGIEAEMTTLMETRLNTLIEGDRFWGHLVLCVARGKESLSFNGSHLEKRPDHSIYLSKRTPGFPLITEAKILDSPSAQTGALYCDHGLRRFVDGDYAWGNREAFMIAYAAVASRKTTTQSFGSRPASRIDSPRTLEETFWMDSAASDSRYRSQLVDGLLLTGSISCLYISWMTTTRL